MHANHLSDLQETHVGRVWHAHRAGARGCPEGSALQVPEEAAEACGTDHGTEARRMTLAEFHDLFEQERAAFVATYPRCVQVKIVIHEGACPDRGPCAPRSFAFADWGAQRITVASRLLMLRRENILGVIRHELGHIADPTPRVDHRAEQRADDIAEYVTGRKIRYDANDVQTVGRGVYPRPAYLPG